MNKDKEAVKRGLQFLSFLMTNLSGQAISRLIDSGAPPHAAALDLIHATNIIQGCYRGLENDEKEDAADRVAETIETT